MKTQIRVDNKESCLLLTLILVCHTRQRWGGVGGLGWHPLQSGKGEVWGGWAAIYVFKTNKTVLTVHLEVVLTSKKWFLFTLSFGCHACLFYKAFTTLQYMKTNLIN